MECISNRPLRNKFASWVHTHTASPLRKSHEFGSTLACQGERPLVYSKTVASSDAINTDSEANVYAKHFNLVEIAVNLLYGIWHSERRRSCGAGGCGTNGYVM